MMERMHKSHHEYSGTNAVIHLRVDNALVGRVIAEKLRRDRLAFQSKAEVRQ